MKSLIVIPARYGSTRLPGKPLTHISGKTMLQRICEIAHTATQRIADCGVLVATDDERIAQHCDDIGVNWVMTSSHCQSGTDRVHCAIQQCAHQPDIIINLQGDAVFTPVHFIVALLDEMLANDQIEVATPVIPLTWSELDQLRQSKKITPFSGTTAIVNERGNAIWFSKNIIPAIRNEDKLRKDSPMSPVNLHVGLYGYRRELLEKYVALEQTPYEILESLEQLRLLEHGLTMRAIKLECGDHPRPFGIDSIEDVHRAAAIFRQLNRTDKQLNDS